MTREQYQRLCDDLTAGRRAQSFVCAGMTCFLAGIPITYFKTGPVWLWLGVSLIGGCSFIGAAVLAHLLPGIRERKRLRDAQACDNGGYVDPVR